jgi:hypothetical protein
MSDHRNRNWLKITMVGCVGAPCLILMLTLGWAKCQVNKIGDRLPAEMAQLRKMGVPLEPEDLAFEPPVPDSENAAPVYRKLIADFKGIRKDPAYKLANPLSGASAYQLTPESDRGLAANIGKFQGFVDTIESLPSYQFSDFKRDYSRGASLEFPEYADIKELARWESALTRYRSRKGDYEGSLRALRTIFAISDHCIQEPTIISALVGIAINAIGTSALDAHLEAFKSNPKALAGTRRMVEALPEAIDLKNALSAEIIMGRIFIRDIKSWNEASFSSPSEVEGPDPIDRLTLGDPAVRRMFEARYLEAWRTAYTKMPADGRDWVGVHQALIDLEKSLETKKGVDQIMNQILFPVFGQFSIAAGRFQAERRLARLSVRLLEARPTGLPNDLSAFGGLAIDPMDGKPMRYIVKDGGFKIWSIGRDLTDDGGKKYYPGTRMASNGTDDVMQYFYPEKPPAPVPGARASAGSPPGSAQSP